MDAAQLADLLLFRSWWSYGPGPPTGVETGLHAFNLFEGAVWFALAALVLRRALRHRRLGVELGYAMAFFTFGLTDFREAYGLPSWLIWVKLANLLTLVGLRRTVIRRFYPGGRW